MNTDQKSLTFITDLKQSLDLASKVAKLLTPPMLIELAGDLGGGKTTFTRQLASSLGVNATVNSPTYNIHKSYSYPGGKLEHFDLYRLNNDELINNQLAECISDEYSITVVEWAKNTNELSSKEKLEINFEYLDANTRKLFFTAHGKKAQTILKELK